MRLGFNLDSVTEEKLLAMKSSLLKISRERVYEECLKILRTGNFTKALLAFKKLDLLDYFLGSISKEVDWDFCLDFWKHSYSESLLKEKDFLWANAFYPLLIQREKEALGFKRQMEKEFLSKSKRLEISCIFNKGNR